MNEIKWFENLHKDAKEIRQNVFIEEQGFVNEFDETDSTALHLVLYINGNAVGTARMFTENSGKSYHFGRIAVLKQYRGLHLGAEIVNAMCGKAKSLGAEKCELSAQCRVKDFYKSLGFEESGDVYYDEFCPHIYMEKKL